MTTRRAAIAAVLAIPIILTACSSTDQDDAPATTTPTQTSSAPATTETPGSATETTPAAVEEPAAVEPAAPAAQPGTISLTDQEQQIVREKCDFLKESPCTDEEVAQYAAMWESAGDHPEVGDEAQYGSVDEMVGDMYPDEYYE